MLTVERMIVLEHKHREFSWGGPLRLDNDPDGRLSGSDLSTSHGMAGRKVSAGGVNSDRVARQDRDVVALGWIQSDLAGKHGRLR